jgi:hypothetical protein
MEDADLAELSAHYARGEERDRLSEGQGLLEFTRTAEIIGRCLPPVPALVADIGGGPGRYALWLAGLGYRVEHRDLMPLHIRQLTQDADGLTGLHTAGCTRRSAPAGHGHPPLRARAPAAADQAARRRTSQTVAAMSSTDSATSQPTSIHWNGQNRVAGW